MGSTKVNILDIGASVIQSQLLKSPPGPKLHQENSWHTRYFSLIKLRDDNQYSSCRVRVSKGFKKLDASENIFLVYWESAVSFYSKKNPLRVLPLYKEAMPCQRQHPINPEKYPFVFTLDIAHRRLFLCADNEIIYKEWLSKLSEQLTDNEQNVSLSNITLLDYPNSYSSIWSLSEKINSNGCDESSADSDSSFSQQSFSAVVFEALSIASPTTNKMNIRRYTTANSKELVEKNILLAPTISLPLPSTNTYNVGKLSNVEVEESSRENQEKIDSNTNSATEATEIKDQILKQRVHKPLTHKRSASAGYMDMVTIKFNHNNSVKNPKLVNTEDTVYAENRLSNVLFKKRNKVFKTPTKVLEDLCLHQVRQSFKKHHSEFSESEYVTPTGFINDRQLTALYPVNYSNNGSDVNLKLKDMQLTALSSVNYVNTGSDVNLEIKDNDRLYENNQSLEINLNDTKNKKEITNGETNNQIKSNPHNPHKRLTLKRSVSTGDINIKNTKRNSNDQNRKQKNKISEDTVFGITEVDDDSSSRQRATSKKSSNPISKFFKTFKKTSQEDKLHHLDHSLQEHHRENFENEKIFTNKNFSTFYTLKRTKSALPENTNYNTFFKNRRQTEYKTRRGRRKNLQYRR